MNAIFRETCHAFTAQVRLFVTALKIAWRHHKMDLFQGLAAAVGVGDHFGHRAVMRVVVEDQVQFVVGAVFRQGWNLPLDWSKCGTGAGLGGWTWFRGRCRLG